MARTPELSAGKNLPPQRIRLWQQRRAVRQMLVAYPPGTDALVDQIRSTPAPLRFLLLQLFLPVYFAGEEGWCLRRAGGEMAAMIYLRREQRQSIPVMHIDDINVDARYRRQGLAERLMSHAEELARREQRRFLKLAVTVANTPAVTLYRRLGYQEQHHQFFTYDLASPGLHSPGTADISLRPLGREQAAAANQRFYHLELRASDPEVADMLVAYYPRGAGGEGIPSSAPLRYSVERGAQPIGYADAYRRGSQWNLRLNLDPDYWGTDSERQVIQFLNGEVSKAAAANHNKGGSSTPFALHVPSAAHFDALAEGTSSLVSQLGLTPDLYPRMIMMKVLAGPTSKKV